jgi:hypothetical protein
MNIYNITFSILGKNLLPPNKRGSKFSKFVTILLYPLQYLRDLVLGDWAYGASYQYWAASTVYAAGTKRLYFDNALYEASEAHTSGLTFDPTKWRKLQDFKAGVFERINYNDKKIVLEAVLNKWFDYYAVVGSPIYIDRVQPDLAGFYVSSREDLCSTTTSKESQQLYYINDTDYSTDSLTSFIVYVPLAQFNALGSTNTIREKIIRSIVDRFNSAGFLYEVTTY